MDRFSNVMREIFSGANGKLSAKRVIGGIGMTVALSATTYLTIVDRSTDVVENLLTTIIILSASLLGLPAITGVFGKSQVTSMQHHEDEDKVVTPKHEPKDPCEGCPHKK